MIWRIERDAALVCAALALGALAVWPRTWAAVIGVVGGGLLAGLSCWAIESTVTGLLVSAGRRRAGLVLLVKFFTRHAILALAAYGMMVRLRADPVALLVGVTSIGLAAAVEAVRTIAAGDQARLDR